VGILDRISRLAKAEANHLFDSASGAAADLFDSGSGRPQEPQAQAVEEAVRWPQEVQEDYAALELPLGADRAALKDAYRSMMLRYHPDRHHDEPSKAHLANELTVRLRQSYERLDAYLAKQAP
jgi:DnaJ-class molecular chaperone